MKKRIIYIATQQSRKRLAVDVVVYIAAMNSDFLHIIVVSLYGNITFSG